MYDNHLNPNNQNQNNANQYNVNQNNQNYPNGQNNMGMNNMAQNTMPGNHAPSNGAAHNQAAQHNAAPNGNSGGQHANSGVYSGRTYNYSSRYPQNFTSASDSGQNYRSTATGQNNYGQTSHTNTKKKKGGFKKVLVAMGLGACFGVCAGLSFYAVELVTGGEVKEAATETVAELPVEEKQENDAEEVKVATNTGTITTVASDVSAVVDKVMPSMVSIVNTYTENISYFGQNLSQEESASGSGIIVGMSEEELLIVTNYHVISGADDLAVSFVDDSVATAQVKGTDASMDLAVIAIPLEDLSEETLGNIAVAELGDSDNLRLGEPAIAIGNALGYGQSVTTGVISALDREIAVSDSSSGTFIQTNAAINPGNSGGALLNIEGQVIGINSNKIGGSAIEGMGYAIPISSAKPIIDELMTRETKTKVDEENMGYLGITGVTVTSDVASVYGMPEGVYVTQVYRGTGAEQAGITKGSIIIELDGISVTSMDELKEALQYYAVGDTVEVTILQSNIDGYVEKTVSVTLGNRIE